MAEDSAGRWRSRKQYKLVADNIALTSSCPTSWYALLARLGGRWHGTVHRKQRFLVLPKIFNEAQDMVVDIWAAEEEPTEYMCVVYIYLWDVNGTTT